MVEAKEKATLAMEEAQPIRHVVNIDIQYFFFFHQEAT